MCKLMLGYVRYDCFQVMCSMERKSMNNLKKPTKPMAMKKHGGHRWSLLGKKDVSNFTARKAIFEVFQLVPVKIS